MSQGGESFKPSSAAEQRSPIVQVVPAELAPLFVMGTPSR
jgi:hypothetical protein